MPVTNVEIAGELEKLADLLEIDAANPFRVRAYRQAARVVGALPRNVTEMVAAGEDLDALPGIGPDLAAKIATLARGETLPLLTALTAKNPADITSLLTLPGLGPKRVHALREALGIDSIEKLKAALAAGALSGVPGFGASIIDRLKEALAQGAGVAPRMKLAAADQIVAPLLAAIRNSAGVAHAELAGSARRRRETVGDLDIVAAAANAGPVMARFAGYEDVTEVLERGSTRASVVLRGGLQVDLRVVGEESYGAALLYFTGSKAHSIALRQIAVERGLKLNEYGLFRGTRRLAARSEAELYKALGLTFIPPELREAEGEIEAARAHRLPNLVTLADISGDLHSHTNATDGNASLAAMAAAAKARGYAYMAITDHSRRMTVAHGLDPKRLARQIEAIARLNRELENFTVLAGIEVDILENGALDLPDDILRRLDIVVGSIHTGFDLAMEKQTERLLRAMDNKLLNIVGHPTGRLINQRPPYAIDMERVIRGAKERGCFLEVNAQPDRLDLDEHHCRFAKEIGAKLAISTDAHDQAHFALMRYGVDQARRGWIEAEDVINTRPLAGLRKLLARK
ncbi:MAG TPA: DNA polymerase/3'-5' exonuclease PolX [Acetobacteraceae bacterium]|nr:DNA polymerase/3'-5' exonuclease PolX [Acetobacteraceae bacterium]